MASSSSVGTSAPTNAFKAQQFYSQFGQTIQALESQIDEAPTLRDLDPVLRHISTARNQLTEATETLPAHDRQLHEKNLTRITQRLTAKRQSLQPSKNGFAFKRTSRASGASPSQAWAPSPPSHSVASSSHQMATSTIVPLPNAASATTYLSITAQQHRYIPSTSALSSSTVPESAATQRDLHILDLSDCLVDLRPSSISAPSMELGALQIRGLRRCIILTGQVKGSIMIHDVQDCWLVIESCRQFRMHTSSSTLISLATLGSIATIESCRHLRFTNGIPPALLPASSSTTHRPGMLETKALQVQDFDLLLSSSHLEAAGSNRIERTSSAAPRNWEMVELDEIKEGVELLFETLTSLDGQAKELEHAKLATILGRALSSSGAAA